MSAPSPKRSAERSAEARHTRRTVGGLRALACRMFLLLREDASAHDFGEVANIAETVGAIAEELAIERMRKEAADAARRPHDPHDRDPS
jgi:hypothetical protein